MEQVSFKDLSLTELKDKLTEEKNTYTKLKLGHAVSPIENPMKIRVTRRNIARLQTELHSRSTETQS
jgi:large subunit ribosomal protein L29